MTASSADQLPPHRRITWPIDGRRPQSLVWQGDGLVDPAGGFGSWNLDGTHGPSQFMTIYRRLDRMIPGPDDWSIAVEDRGTTGVVLHGRDLFRQVHRAMYLADVCRYPAALFRLPDGRVGLVHCPDEYNALVIEDAETGARLTTGDRDPEDCFHSRLVVSPDGRHLLSAGWVWHPSNVVGVYDLAVALEDASHLDGPGIGLAQQVDAEVDAAAFGTDGRLIVSTTAGEALGHERPDMLTPACIGVGSVTGDRWDSISRIDEPSGDLLAIGPGHVVGFFGHPKSIDLATGSVLHRWEDLATSERSGPITVSDRNEPLVAIDPAGRRFAVAGEDEIVAIVFDE